MGYTQAQLANLIELMPRLDVRRIVSWSGTFTPDLFDDYPDNHAQVGWDALRASIDELFPLLDEAEAILLLEPYATHVLRGPDDVLRLCAEVNSPYLGVLLDPPNMLPPDTWGHQAELIRAGTAALAPYVGLIHLKDMRLRAGRLDLTGPGEGVLDYQAFIGAIQSSGIVVPMIISHVTLDQAAAARRFVLARIRL